MSENNNFSDDLFDDIDTVPGTRTPKNTFLPWHHPRKQLVRKEQWVHYIKQNIQIMLGDRTTLSYFSLPGDDLLDIRVLHDQVCEPNNLELKFIGFNDHTEDSGRAQNANLSLAEVKAMNKVSAESKYFSNNILQVGSQNSLAYMRVKDNGDYDVVNLDFCDSIISSAPQADENHYNLLFQLLYIQRSRDKPWLLFLTTRIGREHVQTDALTLLLDCYKENLENEVFNECSSRVYGISNAMELEGNLRNASTFSKVLCTSFCKWLLKNALSLTPKNTIKVLDAMEYTVHSEAQHPDMISIALLFKPRLDLLQDGSGLARTSRSTEILSEPVISSRFLNRFSSTTNCDNYLRTDESKRTEIFNESVELMKSARFDTTNYIDSFF